MVYAAMTVRKKGPHMATIPVAPAKRKSAKEELLEAFGKVLDQASNSAPHRKYMKVAKRVKKTLDQAIASPSRHRDTA